VVHCTVLKYVGRGIGRSIHDGSAGFSADVFRSHLQFISEHRFKAVTLEQVAKSFASGARLPERAVVITFEGEPSFSDAIGNLLLTHKIPATVFVDPRSDETDSLRDRINQIRELGVTIGHQIVVERFSPEQLPVPTEQQVRTSKAELEELLGEPVLHATYAFDVFLGTERKILGRLGYDTASTVATAMAGLHIEPFSIRQSAITEQDDIGRFGWKLWRSGAKPGYARGTSSASPAVQAAGA
jgi:peptidoglycan/xylan/chitin deacetylase (PgdA/CDA1 family)